MFPKSKTPAHQWVMRLWFWFAFTTKIQFGRGLSLRLSTSLYSHSDLGLVNPALIFSACALSEASLSFCSTSMRCGARGESMLLLSMAKHSAISVTIKPFTAKSAHNSASNFASKLGSHVAPSGVLRWCWQQRWPLPAINLSVKLNSCIRLRQYCKHWESPCSVS